jgi:hypothetical protein
MNFTDLFVVAALVSALYALLVAVTRQRHFLTRAVNPHRGAWLAAAVGMLSVGAALLRLEAKSSEPEAWLHVLADLVSDSPMPPRAKIASVAAASGLLFVGLVAWCHVSLPRDPSTFRRPDDRGRAVRYYVGLGGGLDYALLARDGGQRLEEAWAHRAMRGRVGHLPPIDAGGGPVRERTVLDQVVFWRESAGSVLRAMAALDAAVAPARQGQNRRVVFDTEFGGLFFLYLRPPGSGGGGVYLFGATLNQAEVNAKVADRDFDLLAEALRTIDRGLRSA